MDEIIDSTKINIQYWANGVYIVDVNGVQQKIIKK